MVVGDHDVGGGVDRLLVGRLDHRVGVTADVGIDRDPSGSSSTVR